jgi:hypothetical protein
MALTIESASNPAYTAEDGSGIILTVKFEEFPSSILFHATPTDTEAHGVDLYNRAQAGDFGDIAAYVPPAQPS